LTKGNNICIGNKKIIETLTKYNYEEVDKSLI